MACSGDGLLDRSAYKASTQISLGLDSQISQASFERETGWASEAVVVPSVGGQRVGNSGVEHSNGPRTSVGSDRAGEERRDHSTDIQGWNESSFEERVSGIGRVLVGRQLLGGRVFCRDSRCCAGRDDPALYPGPKRLANRACQPARIPGL